MGATSGLRHGVIMAMATVALLGACASRQVPIASVPEDFAVQVLVRPADPAADEPHAALRSAAYLVQPGGEFSCVVGQADPAGDRPAPMRVLDPRQLAQVWKLLQEDGFVPAGSDRPAGAGTEPDRAPGESRCMAAIWVRANGATRWWHLPLTGDDASAEALGLARTCAALAWQSDGLPPRTRPTRFDFGPDPYAAFRAPSGGDDGR